VCRIIYDFITNRSGDERTDIVIYLFYDDMSNTDI